MWAFHPYRVLSHRVKAPVGLGAEVRNSGKPERLFSRMEGNRTSISSKVEKEKCSRRCGSVINALVVVLAPAVEEAEREGEDLQFHHRSETDSGRWVHIINKGGCLNVYLFVHQRVSHRRSS
jgi:hypothetical protein